MNRTRGRAGTKAISIQNEFQEENNKPNLLKKTLMQLKKMMEMAFNESDPIHAYFPCHKIQELAVTF